MKQTIEISKPTEFGCGRSVVRIVPPETVLLENGNSVSIDEPGLSKSNYLEAWRGQGWCCLVGLRSRTAIVIHPEQAQLHMIGPIERLDLGGGYDPGGLERVEFIELSCGDLLIVHEIGVARVGHEGSLKWQRTHDDLTARHCDLQDDVIWFEGEHDRFGFHVLTGDPQFLPRL